MSDDRKPLDEEAVLAAVAQLEQESPGGAEALYMAVMLADAPLPYDFALSMDGAPHNPALVNPAAAFFAVTAILHPLAEGGLIHMDADGQTFTVAGGVGAILRRHMDHDRAVQWGTRAIYGVNLALPDADDRDWDTLDRLMPHIRACRHLIETLDINTAAANRVLHQTGFALFYQGKYSQAVPLLEGALAVDVRCKGDHHPDIITDLEGLAMVHWEGGDLARAEKTFVACYKLQQDILTENNPAMAPILNNLGAVRQGLGRLDGAEEAYEACLSVLVADGRDKDPATASCLGNLALVYEATDRAGKGVELAGRALAINEAEYGPDHPETASDHNLLGLLHERLGNPDQAEEHFLRCLDIRREALGPDHPDTAQAMCNLALLLGNQGRTGEALDLFDAGVEGYARALGPERPLPESVLTNFITLLKKTIAGPETPLRNRAENRLRTLLDNIQ